MTVSTEEVLKQVQDGMKAFEAFKSDFSKHDLKKLDAIDEAKFAKMTTDIASAIDMSQKREAELKAAADRIEKLEAAVSRPAGGKEGESDKKAASEAFNEFLKKGAFSGQSHDFGDFIKHKNLDVKALSVNSDADGGFIVMPAFGGVIETRVFESSPVRQFANIETISTDAFEFVKDGSEAGAGWVGETATRSDTDTPTLAKGVIPTHEMYAQPKATQKLLDDAAVDMEAWLARKVAERFARLEAAAFISGNGAGKPTGILTNITKLTTFSQTDVQVIASGTDGAFTYNGLVDTQNGLKEDYQANARWMTKRANFGSLMKIKSGITDDNTPIFNMNYATNTGLAGFQLLTKPVAFADDVPAVATDALALIYGDFQRGYTVVDRIGIRTLRDPFTGKPYVKFYTTKRVGGDVVVPEAFKILSLSADLNHL